MHNCSYVHSLDVLKGAVAGMIGGLVGSWVMNQFQAAVTKASEAAERRGRPQDPQEGKEREARRVEGTEQEPATVKTAQAISRGLFGHELSENEKKVAEPVVHYAYGTLTGAAYGAAAEAWPATRIGMGSGYGAAVWVLADEVAVPLLKLSRPPTEYPISTHAMSLAAHLVYGITTEVVRRGLRTII